MQVDALKSTRLQVASRLTLALASGVLSLFLIFFASGIDYDYRILLGCSAALAIVFAVLVRPLLQDPAFAVRATAWVLAAPVALGFLFVGLYLVAILLDRSL